MRIYLIGMPFSGKTTTGKFLAEKLNYPFIDLDDKIEKDNQVSINYLFDSNQEPLFRQLEKKALNDCRDYQNAVIATGGGIVLDKQNKADMTGLIVFLNVSVKELEKRSKTSYRRPLLRKTTLKTLYKRRVSMYYDFADIVVEEDKIENFLQYITERTGKPTNESDNN